MEIKKAEEGFWKTFQNWPVGEEWAKELYNYFIMGFPPGSFHTSLFANDLMGAANHSHIGNEWQWIVSFMKWVQENAPHGSWGNYENVRYWLDLSPEERKRICIKKRWVLTDEELTWKLVSEV